MTRAMLYYGLHGPWAEGVEERVIQMVHRLLGQTGCGTGCAARGGITAPGAALEQVWKGGAFTEGPAASRDGEVYFTDIPNLRI